MTQANEAPFGVSVHLRPGDERANEALLDECRAVGADRLRVVLPLAQARDDAARERYRRVIGRAAESFDVVAAFARTPGASAPPVTAGDGAAYFASVVRMADAVGAHCRWFELADPLGPSAWPDASGASATLLRDLVDWIGTPVALGGVPLVSAWLESARATGVLEPFGALAFPNAAAGASEEGLQEALASARSTCDRQALWLTPEHPPTQGAGGGQAAALAQAAAWLDMPAARVFLPWAEDGGAALTQRLLRRGGHEAVRRAGRSGVGPRPESGYDLVTGGAGFVGCNLAARLAESGRSVVVLDDLSRPGTEQNLEWLREHFPQRIHAELGDIRERAAVARATEGAARVFHLAAQVAVTTSLVDPLDDHAINATGTLNLLEALRRRQSPPPLIMTSTNKVYGDLGGLSLQRSPEGYEPVDERVRARGIDEDMPLALSSPYGCSKGAADQYVLDYARSFGLSTAVFRMSCIYGPRQFGNEDQGWVAHFVRQALHGSPITLYGDGYQVRDLLYIDDLVDALLAAIERLPAISGRAFNIGGGVGRATSLLGLLERLERLHGSLPPVHTEPWRASDQRYYVSDVGRFGELTGWRPQVDIDDGVRRLYEWMQAREQGIATDPVAAGSTDRRIAL